ncbi:uncharacterized protein TRUGW13939_01594 [Talaromyces rugulosus]|uniref:F-box domain-containing protein n=1 Tax=Talaromyces rugulosus TaxID=121627 RepID=A0A7H8QKS7_TALRU|nr:uncharacterized protein TRUGW13939_01594 [Talaromyces rugulosus]QKX54507.1 hypothetical protein TRUGW13939_01594 [Talaromyces rugulosus]
MPTAAVEAALSTAELLEAVLLFCDQTTLLVAAQRVSKQWFGVINASRRLQQAMFFYPIVPPAKPSVAYPRSPEEELDKSTNAHARKVVASLNPLLVKHFGSVFFDPKGCGGLQSANHFYFELPWWADGRSNDLSDSPEMQEYLERRHQAFMRSGASWRRMLVSQPAPPALGYGWKERREVRFWLLVWRGYIDKAPGYAESASSSLPSAEPSSLSLSRTGLRFGQLYDLVQYHTGHHEYTTLLFRIVWGQLGLSRLEDEMTRTCEDLLKETSVIVQFWHADDGRTHQPADVEDWDRSFRSEDFQMPDDEPVEVFRGPLM